MKVRTLRRKLEALVRGETPTLTDADLIAVKAFLATLKLNDSKSVEEVCETMGLDIASWFRPRRTVAEPAPTTSTAEPRAGSAASFVDLLRAAFNNDQNFANIISTAKSSRAITKATVVSAYSELFGERSSPSGRTKAQLLQDIADERLTRVRHEKAARALAGTAAE
jgi:hypothetical protein